MVYEIECRGANRQASTIWERLDESECATIEEAIALVDDLRALGEDWAQADYRIVNSETDALAVRL